jgi:hypothetical protein
MTKSLNPYQQVTEAIQRSQVDKSNRTSELFNSSQTRKLIRESDQFLDLLEKLRLANKAYMPNPLRVALIHFLWQCDMEPEPMPRKVSTGQEWVYKAQEFLFGQNQDSDEVYNTSE